MFVMILTAVCMWLVSLIAFLGLCCAASRGDRMTIQRHRGWSAPSTHVFRLTS